MADKTDDDLPHLAGSDEGLFLVGTDAFNAFFDLAEDESALDGLLGLHFLLGSGQTSFG